MERITPARARAKPRIIRWIQASSMVLVVSVLLALLPFSGSASKAPESAEAPLTTNTFDAAAATKAYADTIDLDNFLKESEDMYLKSLDDIKMKRVGLDPKLQAADSKMKVITVSKDGKGNFKTVTDAVKSVPTGNTKRIIIKIGPGVYKEKVRINRNQDFVTFYGDPKNMPTLTYNSRAEEVGTWESASVAVESNYFMAVHIIFENTAPYPGMGAKGGQAVAFRISGDKAAFYSCRFYGYQDTLCDDVGKHYYKECYIRGMEDFIFGNARSLYENCEIVSNSKGGMTAITAQGRQDTADKSGFSFVHCDIKGTGRAYLSRAWRSMARVVFCYTSMGSVVNPSGWNDWGNKNNQKTVFYGEYKCTGPGATSKDRVKYAKSLSDKQVQPFLSKSFVQAETWLKPPPSL